MLSLEKEIIKELKKQIQIKPWGAQTNTAKKFKKSKSFIYNIAKKYLETFSHIKTNEKEIRNELNTQINKKPWGAQLRTAKKFNVNTAKVYKIAKKFNNKFERTKVFDNSSKKMITASEKNILEIYNKELLIKRHGAQIRTARKLGFTKQYIQQTLNKFGMEYSKLNKEETIKYFICKVCENKFSTKNKIKFRNICKFCYDKNLHKCKCGKIYTSTAKRSYLCPKCNYKNVKKSLQKIYDNPEKLEKLRKQRREYFKRFNKKKENKND